MKALPFLVALLLAAGGVSAQTTIVNPDASTPTTLYFHLDPTQPDFLINTQPPDDRFSTRANRGILAPTTTCTPEGTPGQFHQEHHTRYGTSTPGYVEYDYQEQGGPRVHPERGLAYDVELDTDFDWMGYWYLKTTVDTQRVQDDINNLPLPVPQVVVEFTLREGDEVSFDPAAYNGGKLIANGRSAAMLLAPDGNNPAYIAQEDGSHVYEFQIPMTVLEDMIPGDQESGGFNIRVDIYMDIPGCNTDLDASFMPGTIEVFTAPDYRPRLDMAVMNPVQIEYIHPQFVGNDLLIHTSFNSPWGNYDVDEGEGGIEVVITGPTAARSITQVAFTQKFHEHDHHFEAVDVTYQWDWELDGADRDDYDVSVLVWNDQRTASASGSATMDLKTLTTTDDLGNKVERITEGKETPGFGILTTAGLLTVALLARRRA